MIVMPPQEIRDYLYVDENGNWVTEPDMPSELQEVFEEFLKTIKEGKDIQ